MALRRMILLALLGATLAAVWWVGGEDAGDEAEVVQVVKRERQAASGTLTPDPSPRAGRAGDEGGAPQGPMASAPRLDAAGPDLFPSQSWRPPPPPPAALPPPPPPQAPPVPYKYLGRWQEDGADIVFLADGERTRAARKGDRLGGQWRVDGITEQVMTLTYLPLDQTRSLRLEP